MSTILKVLAACLKYYHYVFFLNFSRSDLDSRAESQNRLE